MALTQAQIDKLVKDANLSSPVTKSYSPLTYDDTLPTAGITNIVLIEQGFPDFQTYVNAQSFAIMYSPDSLITDLSAVLHQKFTSLKRIAVVSHYNPNPSFMNHAPLFASSDLLTGATTLSENVQGLVDILRGFNVADIDFLACNTLQDPNWVTFYSLLQARAGVVVGASADQTGNLKYGGNWTMENTHTNVQTIYFNSSILEYASLLATTAVTYPFGILNYSYTAGVNTAILQSATGTLTGAVVIPPYITLASVNYAVVSMTALFTNQTLITSVIITAPIPRVYNDAFGGCTKMTSIVFPDTVTTLGTYCLNGCASLTYFNFPTGVTSIPAYFFTGVNTFYVTDLIIPNRITSIGNHAFKDQFGIKKVYVPPGCSLGWKAFDGLRGVEEISIYGTGTIVTETFGWGLKLKTLTFGEGVTRIENNAFNMCIVLEKVTLPSTLVYLDLGCFAYCPLITYLQIPPTVTFFGMNQVRSSFGVFSTPFFSSSPTFDFMHETNFPSTIDAVFSDAGSLNTSSTIINVSKQVQNMPNYLAMVVRYPNITFNSQATVNYTQYVSAIPMAVGTTAILDALSSADMTDVTIVGSTVAEQKSFTANMTSALFSSNSAQKQLVLPVGSILPGFSAALTQAVHLFNASSRVANGKVTRLTKASILSKKFYVLLESGDTLIVETNGDYVTITRSGNVFTFVTGKAVTSAMSIGNTFVYDGLSLLLGSLYGSLLPTAVDFVLTALNSQLTLNTSAALPSYGATLVSDATITLTGGITEYEAQNTFFFRTDEQINLDASFVAYYVDTSKWTTNMSVLSPKNGTVTTNHYVSGDGVGKDFIRDLARQLFGTYLAADLFTNEDAVVADINTKCDSVASIITLLLRTIDKSFGSIIGLNQDSSGNYYFKDNATTSNISREIFNEMITQAPHRFEDMTLYAYHAGVNDGFYRLPILAGDTLSYKVTIGSATGQAAAVPTGRTTMNPRTYTVTLKVI